MVDKDSLYVEITPLGTLQRVAVIDPVTHEEAWVIGRLNVPQADLIHAAKRKLQYIHQKNAAKQQEKFTNKEDLWV